MEALPVRKLAALSCGLPPESRTMRRVLGMKMTKEEMLLASICDRLSILCWMQTRDGHRGVNRPKQILQELTKEQEEKPQAFESGEAFMAAREAILKGV